MADSFFRDFRRFFLRGLAAVLPTVLTLAILFWAFTWLDRRIASPITRGAQKLTATIWRHYDSSPPLFVSDKDVFYDYFWWVGFLLALIGIYVFGRFVASLLGRGAWAVAERGLFRVPLVKHLYPYVKQLTDFLLSEKKLEFSRVVAVEYPRSGLWSLGLVTGSGLKTLSAVAGRPVLTVFIPSSPTPFTGYVITVPREEVIDLSVTIDEAIRFVVSGGVISPVSQQCGPDEVERAIRPEKLVPQNKEIGL